ncbi:hypothetical protein MTR_8g023230 [Medicago truncatula]|uniref:Uncharacterized protein n=1 Tax=Medicago truncatula TaxID=3880 RepID=G7L9V0_MEDTR|nr:hypothetical protein MTR_8g023230 [Medicago truncatula]
MSRLTKLSFVGNLLRKRRQSQIDTFNGTCLYRTLSKTASKAIIEKILRTVPSRFDDMGITIKEETKDPNDIEIEELQRALEAKKVYADCNIYFCDNYNRRIQGRP